MMKKIFPVGGLKLKSILSIIFSVALMFAFAGTAYSTKPGQTVNPNGFPSGEHFNLNIHGKKDGFTCPEQEYDEFGNPVYGNSIFIPESGSDVKILMQSGTGKKAAEIQTLQVTDPCTAAFDGNAAIVQIPKSSEGYRVYARTLGKPSDSAIMEIMPDLISVEDEFGNDLIYLGLVTSNGFETPYVSFTRKGGKSTAIDITGLFEWSGDVCYLTSGYCDPVESCTAQQLCCTDTDLNGIFESCAIKEGDLCPEGSIETTAFCKTYLNEWVFNIGDFVTYLWDIKNSGIKLLQVRFYPVK
jgi:hypothetical protein